MFRNARFAALAALAGSLFAANSYGQLVVGLGTTTNTNAAAFYISSTDPDIAVATPLWQYGTNRGVYGAAPDQANGILYTTTGARLSRWNFGSQPTAPTVLGGTYRMNASGVLSVAGFDDFTWANGSLYGWTSTAQTGLSHGIYSLPTSADANGRVIASLTWAETTNNYKFEGLTYDPIDGKFYGLNDYVTGGQTLGLYSIDALRDANATPQFVTAYPTGYTRMDGLTVDPSTGKFYMSQDDETNSVIVIAGYTPSTNTYDSTFIGVPLTDASHRGTGLTWAPNATTAVPEPMTGSLALVAGGLLLRKRRSA